MTAKEKILDRIQQLEAQQAKYRGALEVLDELGALEETEPAPPKEKERNPTARRAPPQRTAVAGSATQPSIPPGVCFGKWDGSESVCRGCDGAVQCRAETPGA